MRIFSHFFHFFSLNFRFASIFSLNFRLFYLHFRFRFLVLRIEVNHVKSGFFFASKRNKIFASISNFASDAKVRAHPNVDQFPVHVYISCLTSSSLQCCHQREGMSLLEYQAIPSLRDVPHNGILCTLSNKSAPDQERTSGVVRQGRRPGRSKSHADGSLSFSLPGLSWASPLAFGLIG